MKTFSHIVGLLFLFSVMSCGRMPQHASEADLQDAKAYYDSGFVCLQQDGLLQAFPHFIHVAGNLEYLPEDMTDEEMLLASRAYYQMAYVFRRKMANNAEIALTGISHAEMAVLQGVKYNSFTNRISKIKKVLGTEKNLSAYLKKMLK